MATRPCAWCGAPLRRKPGESSGHWAERRFCGRSCFFAWRKGRSPSDTVGPIHAVDTSPRQRGRWTPEAIGTLAAQVVRTDADEAAFARAWAAWRTKGERA